jgi:hypothetical protein
MNKTLRALIIVGVLLCFAMGCVTPPVQPREILLTIDGVTKIVRVKEHPCEGNWNFCDQVMDDLDSFYIPAF